MLKSVAGKNPRWVDNYRQVVAPKRREKSTAGQSAQKWVLVSAFVRLVGYGHTQLKIPHPVRFVKSSNCRLS